MRLTGKCLNRFRNRVDAVLDDAFPVTLRFGSLIVPASGPGGKTFSDFIDGGESANFRFPFRILKSLLVSPPAIGDAIELQISQDSNVNEMLVSGNLANASGSLTFPKLIAYEIPGLAKLAYSDTGDFTNATKKLTWFPDESLWVLEYNGAAAWMSMEDVATPDLAMLWEPMSGTGSSGIPIVTQISPWLALEITEIAVRPHEDRYSIVCKPRRRA